MLRVLLAGAGFLVDWHQPHETHQPPDTVPPAFMTITLHVARHLTRPIPRLDLSRFRAAPSSHLSHFPFESDGAFPAQC